MTDKQPPAPQILDQLTPEVAPEMPTTQTPIPVQSPRKKNILPFVIFLIIIVVILGVSAKVKTATQTGTLPSTSVTPTPTGLPISTRVLSPFATDSAFLQFEASVDAFPKIIQGAVLQDPTVLPPVLQLPLGF